MTRELLKAVLSVSAISIAVIVAILVTAALKGSDTAIFVAALITGLVATAIVGNSLEG